MSVRPVATCVRLAPLLLLFGCQRTGPEAKTEERPPIAVGSHFSESNKGKIVTSTTAINEAKATRPLDIRQPMDAQQESRDLDLTITWRGDPPSEARVFVDGVYVGRGRQGFTIAVKAIDGLPKRGKVLMAYRAPLVFSGDSSAIACQIPDPFSAWPDVSAAFLKAVSEKEICVRGLYGLDTADENR